MVEVSSTIKRLPLSRERVQRLVIETLEGENVRDALVSVAFVGRVAITRLNEEYLRHPGPTDVISFGMGRDAPGMPVIGDIYICLDVAQRNAARLGIRTREELERLVVHGALHVAGLDHPHGPARTTSRMWKRQERILARRD